MGQDPFLPTYHRSQLLQKVKKMYAEMTNDELRSLRLAERNIISALGSVDLWTSKQQESLFAAVLDSTKQSVSQLDSSILVAMGHFVCGAKASEIVNFNAVEFSKAVHYLVAAGLPDMDMSSLVQVQIEGMTPLAISVVPPAKFSVVFSSRQISMFSHEQAEAVPQTVIDALSYMQKQALDMVLTPWEDRPVDFRGRSLGLALSHCPVCMLLGLLMLLVVPS
ncbi:hypothetical protein WMY93_012805 [Mugilogobius chulae]|uniref:Uncharacterized protein n=1 Tax=Mugilogobius chulae TaxID=88201 RepID=A0AAW0P9R3_9GOBI